MAFDSWYASSSDGYVILFPTQTLDTCIRHMRQRQYPYPLPPPFWGHVTNLHYAPIGLDLLQVVVALCGLRTFEPQSVHDSRI